ncbi:MAG: hypothetical protein EBR27_09250 [Betaproteobacteria bacterium]|nr:hypothetical protein [Betaproteobacteria bacterium]
MGLFFSPLSTAAKIVYATETARQNMSEAERNNFDNVTAEMTASQQNTGRGGYSNSIQSAYAPRSVNSNIPGGISGVASGSVTGGAYFAPDVDKTGAASAGANGSAGGVVSVTQGESQWAKWAAFATVAGVLYEIYKG